MKTRGIIGFGVCILLIFCSGCYREDIRLTANPDDNQRIEALLVLNGKACFYDENSHSLRYSLTKEACNNFMPVVTLSPYVRLFVGTNEIKNGDTLVLGDVAYKQEYALRLIAGNDTIDAGLMFTPLPIVCISSQFEVSDDPKMPAFIEIAYPEPEKPSYRGYIGIEYRGATSQLFPKKCYGFNTLENQDIKVYKNVCLTGNRPNYTWILDAAFIDPARVRNRVSFGVWAGMGISASHQAIQGQAVELFRNLQHQGLYSLNENFNSEVLGLSGSDDVLYKAVDWGNGATLFEFANENFPMSFYWDGWEQKHPDPEAFIAWEPLRDLRRLVVESSDAEFVAKVWEYIDMDNCIDYFLFLNLSSAFDNCGKNIFLMRYTREGKFRMIPWDLDGSWGLFWDGSHVAHTAIISNKLYDRLYALNPDSYREKTKQRWFELRQDVFAEERLSGLFGAAIDTVELSGVVEEENRIWHLNISPADEKAYLNEWIPQRLAFLDLYFSWY